MWGLEGVWGAETVPALLLWGQCCLLLPSPGVLSCSLRS